MKYFLPVQEREAKIPAPVLEAAAWAASAPPPPLTPLSVVLHGKSDCEKSCFAPKELSDMAIQISAISLTTSGENLSFPIPLQSACIHMGKSKVILPKEHNIASTKSLLNLLSDVTQQSFDEEVCSLNDQGERDISLYAFHG